MSRSPAGCNVVLAGWMLVVLELVGFVGKSSGLDRLGS